MFRSGAHRKPIPASEPGDVTELLIAARSGEPGALDIVFEKVYGELHALAALQLTSDGSGRTLGATVLVHEAYLKLVDGARVEYRDRRHFLALAARAMRQIVIDHARRARARKRGGDLVRVVLDPSEVADRPGDVTAVDLLALDEALTTLQTLSDRLARIVELRFFAGLSVEETGHVLGLSPRTVKRDWRKARAILFQALGGGTSP